MALQNTVENLETSAADREQAMAERADEVKQSTYNETHQKSSYNEWNISRRMKQNSYNETKIAQIP